MVGQRDDGRPGRTDGPAEARRNVSTDAEEARSADVAGRRGSSAGAPVGWLRAPGGQVPVRTRFLAWTMWLVGALLSLDYLSMAGYLLAVTGSGVLLHLVTGGPLRSRGVVDRRLLLVMAGTYLLVVALMSVAVRVQDRVDQVPTAVAKCKSRSHGGTARAHRPPDTRELLAH
jgi:hypothetical protein